MEPVFSERDWRFIRVCLLHCRDEAQKQLSDKGAVSGCHGFAFRCTKIAIDDIDAVLKEMDGAEK